MRLIEIITIRKNKFNEHRKNPSFTDFWKGYHEGWYNAYKDLEEILEQKGFDAVPVVRCRECKHYHTETGWCNVHSSFIDSNGGACHPWESSDWKMFEPDDFCSYGERKDGEG